MDRDVEVVDGCAALIVKIVMAILVVWAGRHMLEYDVAVVCRAITGHTAQPVSALVYWVGSVAFSWNGLYPATLLIWLLVLAGVLSA